MNNIYTLLLIYIYYELLIYSVPLHLRSVTKIVGIQTFLADDDMVAINQERQYAKV